MEKISNKRNKNSFKNNIKQILKCFTDEVNSLRKKSKTFDKFIKALLLVLDVKGKNGKEFFVDNFWIILITYCVNKTIGFFFLCADMSSTGIDTIRLFFSNPFLLFFYPFPSIRFLPVIAGAGIFFALKVWKTIYKRPKNTKDGSEYGTSEWGNEETIKPFINPNDDYNLILTKTERLSTSLHPPKGHPELGRNKNVMIDGAPGTGKTRGYTQPNIMQMFGSYIVTDPKGNTLEKTGKLLKDNGYDIRILNLKNMRESNKYNPFHYIKSESDILTLTQILLQIGKDVSEKSQSGDEFWKNAETLMYLAKISYIFYTCPDDKDRNICTLMKMIRRNKVYENNEDSLNEVDIAFRDLEYLPEYFKDRERTLRKLFPNKDINSPDMQKRVYAQEKRFINLRNRINAVKEKYPYIKELGFEGGRDCLPVQKYMDYKLAAGKTAKSILISCAARLSPLDVGEIKDLVSQDELDFYSIGRENTKTALFIVTSDTDKTFNFITTMMYHQLFKVLCDTADMEYGGELPVHVHFILDEFANCGLIPDFDVKISTIRSRNISATIILQSQSQLKKLYDKSWETIESCCSSFLFLGSTDLELLKVVSEKLGKETLDSYTQSYTYGQQKSSNVNHQKMGRELMTPDELFRMPGNKCICMISGLKPFYSDKYDITYHKRYKYIADNPKDYFNVKEYLKEKKKKATKTGIKNFDPNIMNYSTK